MLPKDGCAAGVNLRSYENDAMEIFLAQGLPESAHFVGGVYDRGRKNVDGAIRNALMKEEETVIKFLAGVGDGIFFERGAGFDGIGEPNLRGVAKIVEPSGFEGARRHAAAENGNGGGLLRRIFVVEPAAKVQEREQEEKEKRADNGKPETRLAGAGVGENGRKDHWDREIIRSKVTACASSR